MSKKGGPDPAPAPSQTDVVSAYDESFAVSEDGRVIPITRGERKIAGRYVLGPFYGQKSRKLPAKTQGK